MSPPVVRPLWARLYHAYDHRLPNHPGKATLLRLLVRAAGCRVFLWPLASGDLVAIDPREGLAPFWTVGWTCFHTGVWETDVERVLRDVLEPGMTAIDVGANLGYFTLAMARAVGPQGRVVAFEPVPETAARLRLSVEANDLPHVRVEASALGSESGELKLSFDPRVAGMASAHSRHGDAIRVAVQRLDDFGLGHVDVIKIDVEGHELAVLRGAQRTIAESRPTVVFEVNAAMSGAAGWTLGDVTALLVGYELSLIGEHGLTPLDPTTFHPAGDEYPDILARPR